MRLRQFRWIIGFVMAVALAAPVWASEPAPDRAVPGTLNYVEGTVSIGAQSLGPNAIGAADLAAGQTLTTGKGKAEILLTPGVFLRVGDNSAVRMISPSLLNTEVGLDSGEAMVEVAEIHPQNDIRIAANGETAELLKTGLYSFNLNEHQFRVFDGKALVQEGDRSFQVKGGHEVTFGVADLGQTKPHKFDKKAYEDGDLYRWSSLRSAYVAEANVDAAGYYAVNGWGPWGPGWWGAGWYWDPWFDGFTFIPGDGIFYSPFGWGFYSPWLAYRAPFYAYGGYGLGVPRVYHHFSENYRNWGGASHYVQSPRYARGIYRGPGSSGGAFRSGARMTGGARGFGGGSFGGFHGGGFAGGGFHGGGGRGR
ncbi:MAG: FecR domain-containing protein [Candidatus Acidiferrum sp.]